MIEEGDDVNTTGAGAAKARSEPLRGAPAALWSASEIALNWAGFFVGLVVMTGDYIVARGSITPENWAFLESPKVMVWIFFVAAQFAFWASIIEPLWRFRARIRLDYGLRQTHAIRVKLAAAIVFFAVPGFFLVYVVPDSNIAHHDPKMGIVNLFAVIVALIAVGGIWYVRAALEAMLAGNASAGRRVDTVQERIEVVVDLRNHLQRFIMLLGAMVALATLAKGALRQAILATGGNAAGFPPEYVLLQGAYFTGLLALVYIPTYTLLSAVGADIVESVYPVTAPDLDWADLSKWQSNRKSLEELLHLQAGAVHNLRASVSILAPVATSVMAVLLGAK
jgi:hypothetical protein